MLAISVRVRPCRARSSPRSVGRLTRIWSSTWSTWRRAGMSWLSSPSGPLTITRPATIETPTPSGSWMGLFPIRLIPRSPDEADHLAADTFLLGGTARDHSGRGGQDRGAHPAEHARQAVRARVDAAAGLGDPLEDGGHALSVLSELELDHERVGPLALVDAEVLDVALLLEQPGDLLLEARVGHRRRVVHRLVGVADPTEHVGNRISQHLLFSCPPSRAMDLLRPVENAEHFSRLL